MSSSLRGIVTAWACLVLGILAFGFAAWTGVSSSRTALVLTVVSIVLAFLLAGFAKIEMNRRGSHLLGAGRVGLILTIMALLVVFVGSAEAVRWASVRFTAVNSLEYLGLAFQAYHDEYGCLPPAAVRAPDGRPLLSWRVLLLPYLEDQELYRKFRLDESWDSPHNKPLLEKMPGIYRPVPGNPVAEPYLTYYQVFVGNGTVFEGAGRTWKEIEEAHGCANTILVVEAGEAVSWTAPVDLAYEADQPLPPLGDLYRNEYYVNPRGRFLALFADGSVRCLFRDTPERLLRPLIT
jgi:hypothetical protein